MIRPLIWSMACCLWVVMGCRPQNHVGQKDNQRIEAVLRLQENAWNAGDLDGFMAGYWDSPDLEFVSDKTTHGFQPVRERYFKSYKAEGKEMGVLKFTDLKVSVVSDSEASATGNWKVVKSQDTSSGGFTLTLRKLDNGWKIIKDVTTSDTIPKKE
jgi:ketosteroid isomerase-like protein